jgi:uncharacterized protein
MGPTFVKLGQLLSTRADVLPPIYLQALRRLQDDVEPVPFDDIEHVVTTELGVRERLSDHTVATHHAIVSLMEELEAMDWYRQRADDCDDTELKAVLLHNMNDEMEHAAMLVEWLRRNVDEFATQLGKFVGAAGPIVAPRD